MDRWIGDAFSVVCLSGPPSGTNAQKALYIQDIHIHNIHNETMSL